MSIPRSCLKSDRRKPASCYKDSVLPHSTMRDCIMDLHWKPSLCLVFLALSGSFIWSVGVSLNVCNYMGQGAFSTVSLIYMVSSLFEKLMGFVIHYLPFNGLGGPHMVDDIASFLQSFHYTLCSNQVCCMNQQ